MMRYLHATDKERGGIVILPDVSTMRHNLSQMKNGRPFSLPSIIPK